MLCLGPTLVQFVQDFSFLSGGIWVGKRCHGFIRSIVGEVRICGDVFSVLLLPGKKSNSGVMLLTFCQASSAALRIQKDEGAS
ncbi:uncharacterized protein Dyak_GE28033 [Drosophila yakuba]|uniref:Uncharacterized protein n=1 Tax=Drosophila yakuba TaxID=7245 RepID=A0A0R1DU28_DROYA|nr:uncharacterized protein Dyak_GE28033 [Drosophila yakuba]